MVEKETPGMSFGAKEKKVIVKVINVWYILLSLKLWSDIRHFPIIFSKCPTNYLFVQT